MRWTLLAVSLNCDFEVDIIDDDPFEMMPLSLQNSHLLDIRRGGLCVDSVRRALAEHRRVIVSGPQGCGKTEIAIQVILRAKKRNKYRAYFWVRADSESNISADFLALASRLGVIKQNETNKHVILKALLTELNYKDQWLLVLDGLNNIDLLTSKLPDNKGKRHVLITTRYDGLGKKTVAKEIRMPHYQQPQQKDSFGHIFVGIDFGTTSTGVAYVDSALGTEPWTCIPDLASLAEHISVVTDWPKQHGQSRKKTPTAIAYENGKPVAWGEDAKGRHATRVKWFKLGLQEDAREFYLHNANVATSSLSGNLIAQNWETQGPPGKRPVDYVRDYLCFVYNYVRDVILPNRYGTDLLQNQKISYAITVPAIWTEKAKDLTREAARKAGIPMNNFRLITEPEAAALYCATTLTEVDLFPGDYFLICDAGGGTVVNIPSEPKS